MSLPVESSSIPSQTETNISALLFAQTESLARFRISAGENIKKDNEIENLADKDEIYILIKLFQGDETKFIEFKKKLIIYAKLKENIINKYKAEEKSYNKKVYSMEEQIEYLNHKVKESEMRINIFQQQLNDKEFKNKKLKKQLIEEKKEKEDSKQKLENK